MLDLQTKAKTILNWITMGLQIILNSSLALLAIIISCLLIKELIGFMHLLGKGTIEDYYVFLETILVFFIYFEFISMIVKYFKENYHFPMRYFFYIGITAMIRFIIVDHGEPERTVVYAFVILILIICFFVLNLTPRERPERYDVRRK
jgi:protein PsiE